MCKYEDSIEVQPVNQYEKPSSNMSSNVGQLIYLLPALFVGVVAYYIYVKTSENISKRERTIVVPEPQTILKKIWTIGAHYIWIKVSENIDLEGKYIANSLCLSSIIAVLAVGFAQIGKQLQGGVAPRLNFSGRDILITTLDISGALVTNKWVD